MNLPNEILLAKIKRMKRDVDFLAGRYKPDSWQDVRDILEAGLGQKVFQVGDQIETTFNSQPQVVDIIGVNHDAPNSITIQFHDCLLDCQWDAPEALYYAEEKLPAGEQIFTIDTDFIKYKFTTTQPVPIGGQVAVASWAEGDYVPATLTTYDADRKTVIETDLPVEAVESGDDTMLNLNVRARARYGSNNYLESNIREWLNSDASSFTWTPQTIYDRPPTGAPYTGGGFLHLLDPELVAVLGTVDKQVARNTATDGGGQDTFSDKVFLLSRVEVYGGTEGETSGEAPYPYYESLASSPTTAALDGRIKYLGASARHWWLRSPTPTAAHDPRNVHPGGNVSGNGALNAYGVAPACCVI